MRVWYSVVYDRDDYDFGFGSFDLVCAKRKLQQLMTDGFVDALVAVILLDPLPHVVCYFSPDQLGLEV